MQLKLNRFVMTKALGCLSYCAASDEQGSSIDYFHPRDASNEFENCVWDPREYFLRMFGQRIALVVAEWKLLIGKIESFHQKFNQREEMMYLTRHVSLKDFVRVPSTYNRSKGRTLLPGPRKSQCHFTDKNDDMSVHESRSPGCPFYYYSECDRVIYLYFAGQRPPRYCIEGFSPLRHGIKGF
jgi:hypothetical protein